MVDISTDTEEMLTVQDAAQMLGVHPNTVRNRIKAGQYRAEWAPSPHGPRQLIPRSSLVSDPSQDPGTVHAPLQTDSSLESLRETQEQALQRVVSPFLERLEAVVRENGRLQEVNRTLEAELERLKARSEQSAEPTRSWWQRLFALS